MTIDRDQLRARLAARPEYAWPSETVSELLDQLDQTEARIGAAGDVLDQSRDNIDMHTYPEQLNADIRRALEG